MSKPQIKMGASISDYHQVTFAPSAMLSPYATVIGAVCLGEDVSVFAGAHIRGDCEPIRIGDRTNVQENSSLHVSVGSPLTIGDDVTIGHNATVHGCTIGDNVLVGMGSIILDDAVIGRDSVVGAGALVTQRKQFPPRSLILGAPAKAVRELTDEEVESMVTVAAAAYVEVAQNMTSEGLMVHPEPDANIWMTSHF